MSGDVVLQAFPDTAIEGLSLVWVKNHAKEAKTPQELCSMYWEAYYQIVSCYKDEIAKAKAKFKEH